MDMDGLAEGEQKMDSEIPGFKAVRLLLDTLNPLFINHNLIIYLSLQGELEQPVAKL